MMGRKTLMVLVWALIVRLKPKSKLQTVNIFVYRSGSNV